MDSYGVFRATYTPFFVQIGASNASCLTMRKTCLSRLYVKTDHFELKHESFAMPSQIISQHLFLLNKSTAGMHDTPPRKFNLVQMHRISWS